MTQALTFLFNVRTPSGHAVELSSAYTSTFRPLVNWGAWHLIIYLFLILLTIKEIKKKQKQIHTQCQAKGQGCTSIDSTEALMTFEESLVLLSSVLYNICESGKRKCTYRVCLFICSQSVSCWPLWRESHHSHSASLCFCSHAHNPFRR